MIRKQKWPMVRNHNKNRLADMIVPQEPLITNEKYLLRIKRYRWYHALWNWIIGTKSRGRKHENFNSI